MYSTCSTQIPPIITQYVTPQTSQQSQEKKAPTRLAPMMIHPDASRLHSTQPVEGWLVLEDPVELDVLDEAALHARFDVALEVLLS
jgi:hypothetical protein